MANVIQQRRTFTTTTGKLWLTDRVIPVCLNEMHYYKTCFCKIMETDGIVSELFFGRNEKTNTGFLKE